MPIKRGDPCSSSVQIPRTMPRPSFFRSKRSGNYEAKQLPDQPQIQNDEEPEQTPIKRRKLNRSVCSIRDSDGFSESIDTVPNQERSSKAGGDMTALNPNESAEKFSDFLRKHHELTPHMATLKRESHVA